jgi:hypothetical protein
LPLGSFQSVMCGNKSEHVVGKCAEWVRNFRYEVSAFGHLEMAEYRSRWPWPWPRQWQWQWQWPRQWPWANFFKFFEACQHC